MLIKDVIQKTTQFFREKGFQNPRLDTELLIASALHWERMKLYLNYDYPLTEAELSVCRELVRRRASGEPVAYILGHKGFFKHTFKVTPAVLIPRPETESMVEEVLAWANSSQDEHVARLRVVDFGTGSGCIGLSLMAEMNEARLLAVDVSQPAIEVATENAVSLGVADRTSFVVSDVGELTQQDVMSEFGALADAVVANPPYIAADDSNVEENVRKYEPQSALFSGKDGLSHIRQWSMKAAEITRAGAFVIFEIGHEQGRAAKEIFESVGHFKDIEIQKDLSGKDRFIRCYRSEEF